MYFREWWYLYLAICDDLNIDRRMDYLSSVILSNFVGRGKLPEANPSDKAYVIGNGPDLPELLGSVSKGYHIVADSAIRTYYDAFGCPAMIVTDLDGDTDLIFRCHREGTSVVIHAHGNNIYKILDMRSSIEESMVGTTPNVPYRNVRNFFGFTDGDRSAYIADAMGFQSITLVAFDFERVNTSKKGNHALKAKKLKWARSLIAGLAAERHSVFSEGPFIEI